jgi:hypothetical protein
MYLVFILEYPLKSCKSDERPVFLDVTLALFQKKGELVIAKTPNFKHLEIWPC